MATAHDLRTVIEEFLPNIRKSRQLAVDSEACCRQLLGLLDGGAELDDEDLLGELDKMILFILNRPDAELRQRLNELQEYLGRENGAFTASSFGIFAHI
ncbi:MAG: hypothetical protein HY566_02820 [Candidatus Kerfeldbacteria bacterium]|nr:hypothetical protein [Candidatus Kerfeldbacteria bacterium]